MRSHATIAQRCPSWLGPASSHCRTVAQPNPAKAGITRKYTLSAADAQPAPKSMPAAPRQLV